MSYSNIDNSPIALWRVTSNQRPPAAVVDRIAGVWQNSGKSKAAEIKSAQTPSQKPDLAQRLPRRTRSNSVSVGDYEVVNTLGQGAMGVVYLARQTHLDREVALKVLKKEYASGKDSEKQINRFLIEACITADLAHANIVPVYEIGVFVDGDYFMAMKVVRGDGWDHVIKRKTEAENLDIFMKVCDAVAFAHSKGVIHRDIKPENVHLDDFGEVLLMDWGLAIPTDDRPINGLSETKSLGGTPAYMPPEAVIGQVENLDQSSDIYLLGAVLFEVITGKTPHTGKDVGECIRAAASNKIQPTEVKGELLDIAMKCMETKPQDRYANVADLQNAIREYSDHAGSVSITDYAEQQLTIAMESGDYQSFSRAVIGFEEALTYWSGNSVAGEKLRIARLHYARAAIDNEDLDLAISLLDAADPSHQEELSRATEMSLQRRARTKSLGSIRRMLFYLLAFMLVVATAAAIWIYYLTQDRNYWRGKAQEQSLFQRDETHHERTYPYPAGAERLRLAKASPRKGTSYRAGMARFSNLS